MLEVIRRVLDDLHQADVRYCHWKSNVRIADSLSGHTDMDILVDPGQRSRFLEVLYRYDFKQVRSPLWQSYPGIEDYIGFDGETGQLTHFHVHYELVLGEPMLKGYRLPWERAFLEARVFNQANNIYIASSEWELLLLLVRWALKLTRRVGAGTLRGQGEWAGYFEEYDWLKARVDRAQVIALSQQFLGEEAGSLMSVLLQNDPTGARLWQFRCAIQPYLRRYRRMEGIEKWRQVLVRRGMRRLARSRLGRWGLIASKKTLPSGGRIIALVGIDGSGKSTLAQELVRWLSWKLDAQYVYLGHGAGWSSWVTECIKRLLRMGGKRSSSLRPKSPAESPSQTPHAPQKLSQRWKQWIKGGLYGLLALSIARDRWRKIHWARHLRNRGSIVITDRWIQNKPHRMDCPMLPALMERYPFLRIWGQWVARYEQQLYDQMAQWGPDLVIRLRISPQTALQRKDDLSLPMAQFKAEVLDTLEFADEPSLVEVDAEQPLETVLLEVKRALWQHL